MKLAVLLLLSLSFSYCFFFTSFQRPDRRLCLLKNFIFTISITMLIHFLYVEYSLRRSNYNYHGSTLQ